MQALRVAGRLSLVSLIGFLFYALDTARAENFTTNIVSAVSSNAGGQMIVGNTGSFNFLRIQLAGSLTNTDGIIGNNTGADFNSVVVSNAGSYWDNTSSLYVGNLGASNRSALLIRNGTAKRGRSGLTECIAVAKDENQDKCQRGENLRPESH